MKAEIRDSLSPLFPDSRPGSASKLELDVARNGTIAVHVFMTDLKRGSKVSLALLQGSRRVPGAKWFRLIDVPVERNTGPVSFVERKGERNPYVVRRAPFRVYDALEPVGSSFASPGPAAAARLHLKVPAAAKPGLREFRIRVRAAGKVRDLRLKVQVHAVRIPPSGRDSLPYTNWFPLHNMAVRHGLKPWTGAHYAMIGKYARLMRHARQNMFLLPLASIGRRTARGIELDRARLRKLVGIFTRAGLHFIEGGHFAGRTGGEWKSPTFSMTMGGPRVATLAGDTDAAFIGRQLYDEIRRNGWAKRWVQHAADEPTDVNAYDYRALVGMIRKYMPGLPVLDATESLSLAGSVDYWCPQCHQYQRHRKDFEKRREVGDRVWFYTCCFPGGKWLNRLLDMEPLRPALFGWAAALFGLDGFLHWGFNYYGARQDPFKQSVIPHGGGNFLPAGDTHVAYPGKGGPWSSLRLEAQREGFEDYELLKGLKARRPAQAKRIIRRALRGFGNYTKDVRVFRAARRALLSAASGR